MVVIAQTFQYQIPTGGGQTDRLSTNHTSSLPQNEVPSSSRAEKSGKFSDPYRINNCCEAVRRVATLIMTQQSLDVGSLCTVYGKNISNLSTALSVVPDFSEDARNMVGQKTFSVVRVFGQCSENATLQYMSCGNSDILLQLTKF